MKNKRSKVIFQTTTKCNDKCTFCFAPKGMEDLTLQEHMKILQNLISLNISEISWTGGECLLVPHIKQLLEFAKNNGITNILNTNGGLIPQKLCHLKDFIDSINLSATSFNPETIERLNRDPRHERIILDAIEEIQKQGNPLRINTVVTALNKNDLEQMGEIFEKLCISKWLFMEYSPIRNHMKQNVKNSILSHDEFETIVNTQKLSRPSINIETRICKDYEEDLDLILADGRFTRTKNSQDIIIGNPLIKQITREEFVCRF
jgi:MoaA/NifB/PqqE/SkfB family radical SAM enzyme